MSAGSGRFALLGLAVRYASHYASVTPRSYLGFYEQEPTLGEGGESKRFIACDIQAGSHRMPDMRIGLARILRDWRDHWRIGGMRLYGRRV